MNAVGERTSRVKIGTSVLTPTVRYTPAVVAQPFATMAMLSPGRVMLGIGTGEALNEIAVSGRKWPDFKERYARLPESGTLIRRLWTEDEVSTRGDYFTTVKAKTYDRPEQPIPVYVAAGGPMMAKYAGRVADGFVCTAGKGIDLYTDRLLPAVAEGVEVSGRAITDIDR